jgi:hypothetical protein
LNKIPKLDDTLSGATVVTGGDDCLIELCRSLLWRGETDSHFVQAIGQWARVVLDQYRQRLVSVVRCLDDVDALMVFDELGQVGRKRNRPQAQTVGRDPRLGQMSARLLQGEVDRTGVDQADASARLAVDDRFGDETPGGLGLAPQALHVGGPLFRALGVPGVLVVAGPAGEVGRQRVRVSR